jgi:Homeodomain-like domain
MAVSVATPLERQLSQIPRITQMSQSTVGSSQVTLSGDDFAISQQTSPA